MKLPVLILDKRENSGYGHSWFLLFHGVKFLPLGLRAIDGAGHPNIAPIAAFPLIRPLTHISNSYVSCYKSIPILVAYSRATMS